MRVRNPNIDLSAVDAFWPILDCLTRDKEPSAHEWGRLFGNPGYRTLFRNDPNFREDLLREGFSLAYRPSRVKECRRACQEERWKRPLDHYANVRKRRTEIQASLDGLARLDVTGKARRAAAMYLPASAIGRVPDPPVSFLIFKNDAKGFSSRVLMDALAWLEWDDPLLLLAHEFHHYFRARVADPQADLRKGGDREVEHLLELVESEGVADLVNRLPLFAPDRVLTSRGIRYVRLVRRSPHFLRILDKELAVAALRPTKRLTLTHTLIDTLPDGGHQVGFYMARTILDRLGKPRVIACVGDPIRFFQTYAEAAELPPRLSSFSQRTLAFLGSLNAGHDS